MRLPSLFREDSDYFANGIMTRMNQLQRQMEKMFDDFQYESFPTFPALSNEFIPNTDLEEAGDHYLLSMDLPGMKKEDIKIEFRNNILTVAAERSEESETKGRNRYRANRYYGAFERSFNLPEDVKADQIATEYKDGVLRIAIPKTPASKAQQIPVGQAKPGFFEKLLKHEQKAIEVKEPSKVA